MNEPRHLRRHLVTRPQRVTCSVTTCPWHLQPLFVTHAVWAILADLDQQALVNLSLNVLIILGCFNCYLGDFRRMEPGLTSPAALNMTPVWMSRSPAPAPPSPATAPRASSTPGASSTAWLARWVTWRHGNIRDNVINNVLSDIIFVFIQASQWYHGLF